jgi:FkbM family methyltransferase
MGNEVRRLGGSIISIEPVPLNLERQRKNVAANQLEDLVTYIPCAVGREHKLVRIKTDPVQADNNAIIADDGDLEIMVRPLDDLAAEGGWGRIGLIKMDVEGYEPMVIEGAKATLRRDRPLIFAEFLRERMDMNGFSMSNSWQFLVNELDYVCYIVTGRKGKLRLLDDPGRAENLVFVPRDTRLPMDLLA